MMRALPCAATALLLLGGATAAPLGARHLMPSGELKQCIAVGQIRAETAETDGSLLFHADGSRVFRNHLPAPCERLMRINNVDQLRLPPRDQLCRGDVVQVIDHGGPLGVIDGSDNAQTINCTLGGFEPTNEMSITEQLRR